MFGAKLDETLAGIVILFMVLIPYFAIRVLSEALGEGRLARMFFVERESVPSKGFQDDVGYPQSEVGTPADTGLAPVFLILMLPPLAAA